MSKAVKADDGNVHFKFDISFDPKGESAQELWDAIAALLVASAGKAAVMEMINEATVKMRVQGHSGHLRVSRELK